MLSPTQFNVYQKIIFDEASEGQCGVTIGEDTIIIRYADDPAIVAESIEDLQFLIHRVNKGLTINSSRTRLFEVSKQDVGLTQLIVNNEPIAKVL